MQDSRSDLVTRMRGATSSFKEVFFPPSGSVRQQYEEYKHVSIVMTVVSAIAGATLWVWDYVLDPAGAHETVWLRLLVIPTALPYLSALWLGSSRHFALACAACMFVGWEVGFFEIMHRLDGGFVYGLAGFMFFVFMPLLLARCFIFIENAALIVGVVLFPLLIYSAGLAPDFKAGKYAVLLIPAGNLSLIAAFMMAWLHCSNQHYRAAIEREAATDALTGLANRRRFNERLQQQSQNRGLIGLLTIDLDHFKRVNDSVGHGGGDELLRQVAARLLGCVRDGDEVARLGGDEFAIVLEKNVRENEASAIAERIVKAFEHPFTVAGLQLVVSVSIGVTLQPTHTRTPEQIFESADAAMYKVKAEGRRGFRVAELGDGI